MKKICKMFLLIICLLIITGCGKSKIISGIYEWRPYNDNDEIYAYYDFKENDECTFLFSDLGDLKAIPQTYTYTIKKEDSSNYTLTLTNINKDEEIILYYNSKTDILTDNSFKDIEENLGRKGRPSDNKYYGQFKKSKLSNSDEKSNTINKNELNKLLNKLDNPNNEIMIDFKDSYNYKRVYYDKDNNTINIIKSDTENNENIFIELVIDLQGTIEETYMNYFHLNVNDTNNYASNMIIKFDIPFKNNSYNYNSKKTNIINMIGYKKEDEIELSKKYINKFFNNYDDILKSTFNTSWKSLGFYS